MNNRVVNYHEAITREDIGVIEKQYKFSFPEEIIQFYLACNGGTLEKKIL